MGKHVENYLEAGLSRLQQGDNLWKTFLPDEFWHAIPGPMFGSGPSSEPRGILSSIDPRVRF